MLRFSFTFICSFTFLFLSYSQSALPAEAKPFVLKDHEMLDYITGDLNGDNKADALLILKQPGEDSIFDERLPRPLLLLIRQSDNKLKQVIRNDSAIMGRHDGGVFGDPYQGASIFKSGFNIAFYGGSSWRWAYDYEFRWNSAKKKWLLHKESFSSFNSGDMEGTMRSSEVEAAELGEISIGKFSTDIGSDHGQWKVKSLKTYFYDDPKLGSKPRKGYLVKGNIATGIRVLKNFVEISYSGKDDAITYGYVLKKDLVRVE